MIQYTALWVIAWEVGFPPSPQVKSSSLGSHVVVAAGHYHDRFSCPLTFVHRTVAVGNDVQWRLNHKNQFHLEWKTKRKALVAITSWDWHLLRISQNQERSEKPGCEFLNFHSTILEMAIGPAEGYAPQYQTDPASNPGFALFQVCDLGLVTLRLWAYFLICKTEITNPTLLGCPANERKSSKYTVIVSGT